MVLSLVFVRPQSLLNPFIICSSKALGLANSLLSSCSFQIRPPLQLLCATRQSDSYHLPFPTPFTTIIMVSV
jgi:hypothetical protein